MKRLYLGFIAAVAISVAAWGLYATIRPAATTYTDQAHRFSVELPAGSTEQDFHSTDGYAETLILRDGSDYVQVSITSWAGSADLTETSPARDSLLPPNVTPQAISVAGRKGIAFEALPDSDSNVWVASGGYLYQLVEFRSRSDFLRTVTAHWKFN